MRIEIAAHVRDRLRRSLRSARRREIGGILMAEQIEPGHFRVVDLTVDGETGGRAHFVRSAEAHADALDAFFRRTGEAYSRYNYLGEWHSHPVFPVTPSVQDAASMTELVQGDVYQWGSLMAGSLLGSLPVAIFYSFFVDYYVSSLTGAVKE